MVLLDYLADYVVNLDRKQGEPASSAVDDVLVVTAARQSPTPSNGSEPRPSSTVPTDSADSRLRGIELFQQGRFKDAACVLGEALNEEESSETWGDWAAAELACGHTEKAEDGFRRAVTLGPDNGQALVNLGAFLANSDRAQEAIPFLEAATDRVDESERIKVAQLLVACRTKAASDVLRQSRVAFRAFVSGFQQSSSPTVAAVEHNASCEGSNRAPEPSARPAPATGNGGSVPSRFDVIHRAPVFMSMPERVVLYSLVAGLRPRRSLEIGTLKGGSALIIVAALDDVGGGNLSCVDPNPSVSAKDWQEILHRATMVKGASPNVLPSAAQAANGKFDFALIDGDHSTQGVVRDIEGVLPYLEDGAYLLFHDAHNAEVAKGIAVALRNHEHNLINCGMLSTEVNFDSQPGVFWGGLQLLRFCREA